MLTAILVAGFGRSGSTALMSLLAGGPRVACDRVYPFENRYLTYLAKLAVLLERQDPGRRVTAHQLYDFANAAFGAHPWPAAHAGVAANEWLRNLWQAYSAQAALTMPGAGFYAEKAPAWLPALARESIPASTIYLFRDPRDIYLSANALMRRRGSPGFDRTAEDTDLDYARTLAHRFLNYFENYYMDRRRQDCTLVKYEDMILQRDDLPVRLARELGVECRWDDSPWLETHRTTPDLVSSVGRWRREPVPEEANRFLRDYLGTAMAHLGYAVERGSTDLPAPVEFRAGACDAGGVHGSGGRLIPGEDAGEVTVTTGDFRTVLPWLSFDAGGVREIWVSVQGAVGDVCSVYWRAGGKNFEEERSVHVPYAGGRHWQVVRIPVAGHSLWKGTIGELRMDLFNWKEGGPGEPATGYVRWARLVA